MRRSITMALSALALMSASASAQKQTPPPALPLSPVAFPPFVERTLSNGARVLIVENHEQPVASVNLYIKGAGSIADPDAKPGVADITASLIDAGTGKRTSKQIAEALEGLGVIEGTSASLEWGNISTTMLKTDLDAVMEIVADFLVNPTYPADEVDTYKKRSLTNLQVSLSQPATLAQRQFEMAVFGKHPYGRQQTTTGLRSITREDVVAFHQANYKPSNALFVVAGDVNPNEVTATLEKHFAAWKGTAPARPTYPVAPDRAQREIILVNKPGTVQASYRIGQTIVPATNPDWPALTVAQQILGGSSSAWLYKNLRDTKGFTYGAYSQSTQRVDPGYWYMWGDVRNAVADSALDMFIALAQQLKDKPVSQEDLDMAKGRLTGSFPLSIETPTQIAGQVATALLLGQGKDHVQTWRQRLGAVTAADVQSAAKKYLRPENSLIVISGDAQVLKPKLERFGKVTIVDEEGRPVAEADTKPVTGVSFDASSVQPGTLVYGVTVAGMGEIMESTRTITRETIKGKDVVHAKEVTTGRRTGTADLVFEAKTFKPMSSTMSMQMGGMEMNSMLTIADGKITGMMKMPQQTDPQMVDSNFPEGTILEAMADYAIWVSDLAPGKEIKFNLFNAATGTSTPVSVKVTGESKVKVAAGEFDTYEMDLKLQQGSMKVYAQKAAPHIVIKQELVGQPVVIELKSKK
ncbi:MAG TPA: pitrilysin family protein [Longimicrobiales bacterium]|nr:pitrilysin family protein [Longimicrobiales bacterium]